MSENTNFGERRRDVLARIISRRMSYADKFFGVGERPYGTKAVPDAQAIEMYGRMSPAQKLDFYEQLTPEDQAKLKTRFGGQI